MYYKRYVFHFEKRRLRINRVEFYADALLRSITKHSVYLNVHIIMSVQTNCKFAAGQVSN